ncbi:modified peptide precursor CbpA [Desulfobacca acetoxidans]|jgi:modified peptide precursor CbpA|uniref:Uncharacterized protein n=1 Tax=Desulfobacca acetoxidans (strain ATCC 700848 / DSM 11109 / ASRB2) TaxID=880072 RepID=F2NHG7_DESAR|nr:modified peptide precursor CbpA [Desulfobacca acetoxidans]AEB09083.1 hypothetical protein Desac_1222 [Desulfobacca acetoxidans DSM 11109]
MQQKVITPDSSKKLAPIGYRYSCKSDGTNTGLSHYILLDNKK